MTSRTPDFVLKGLNTQTNERTGKLGAAWTNEDGTVSIRFDSFIILEQRPGWIFTLFPKDTS